MRISSIIQLIVLAAIWGGSFIFMRWLVPTFGPVITAAARVLIAGAALHLYFKAIAFDPDWRRHWKKYLIIGATNSGLPFFFFSFAALHIPASLSVILNSTSPFFGALFAALWLNERLTWGKIAGLIVGALGVTLVVKLGAVHTDAYFALAVAACIGATFCYGFSAAYVKKFGQDLKPVAIAGCSQTTAGLVLLLGIPFEPLRGDLSTPLVIGMIVFGLLCSAVAYLLYYRLIVDLGPTKALTVTFLMPAFGMIWGVIFLHETITLTMILGTLLILLGTGLTLNLIRRRPSAAVARS